MSFPIPVFPLAMNVWNSGHRPSVDPPDFVGVPGQIYLSPHEFWAYETNTVPTGILHDMMALIKFQEGIRVYSGFEIVQPDPTEAAYWIGVYSAHFYLGFPQAFWGMWSTRCTSAGNNYWGR